MPLGLQALNEMKRRDEENFEAQPFGIAGEMSIPRRREPLPPAPEPFRIPPVDWDLERQEREQREAADAEQRRRRHERALAEDTRRLPAKPGPR